MTDKPAESAVERYNIVAHSDGFMLATHPPYTFAEFRDLADAAIAELQAENEALRRQVEALKVCGNCNHWWSGLMGCAMDSSQAVVCEGFDHCKVFTQLADKPETREPCWTDRRRRS